jgi:hypothetical protein
VSQVNVNYISNLSATAVVPVTPVLAGLASGFLVDSGSVNALIVAPTPAWATFTPGALLLIKVVAGNTGATTLTVSGLTAKNVTRPNGTALSSGDVSANGIYAFIYDGINFQLLTRN